MRIKTYSELITLPTFEERFEYLQLKGTVGQETFGFDRYLNQILYNSKEWKHLRNEIIVRDNGCDLALEGFEIHGRILIHHKEVELKDALASGKITIDDVIKRREMAFDPENLICVTHNTHNAIHYGDKSLLITGLIERRANDTCPWK